LTRGWEDFTTKNNRILVLDTILREDEQSPGFRMTPGEKLCLLLELVIAADCPAEPEKLMI
jgi:hypothetical protein